MASANASHAPSKGRPEVADELTGEARQRASRSDPPKPPQAGPAQSQSQIRLQSPGSDVAAGPRVVSAGALAETAAHEVAVISRADHLKVVGRDASTRGDYGKFSSARVGTDALSEPCAPLHSVQSG